MDFPVNLAGIPVWMSTGAYNEAFGRLDVRDYDTDVCSKVGCSLKITFDQIQ